LESPLYEIAEPDLKVIETLRFDPQDGFVRLDMHLARAARTCARLRYPFDPLGVRQALTSAVGKDRQRCRVTIDRTGAIEVTVAALPENPAVWTVALSDQKLASNDPWLGHKTTHRAPYDAARAAMPDGIDEVILCNEFDALCEGTISNIFVQSDAELLTPALACGLLPGVLRQKLLETGKAREAHLTLEDLKQAPMFFMGNSLRGLIAAKLV
jgi:4-amino-4-deoxychorismate lyase